jgi:phosphinothricin acetyltransferase
MPPEPFLIRDATRFDIPAIGAIYRPEVEHGLSSWEEEPPSDGELAARMDKIIGAGLPYLAAERDGAVLGYAYAGFYHGRSAYRYTLEDTVYIDPGARGQGVGKALMVELLARSEAVGCRQMMALIRWIPDSPSIALHKRLGFRMIGIAEGLGYKFGGWLDLALMQKTIGAGNTASPDWAWAGRKADV